MPQKNFITRFASMAVSVRMCEFKLIYYWRPVVGYAYKVRLVYPFCSNKLAAEASISSIGSTASSSVLLRPQSG